MVTIRERALCVTECRGWWLRQSLLFEEVVVRGSELLLRAEDCRFLFLCKLQFCLCHLPMASCQPLWEPLFSTEQGGLRMEPLSLSLSLSLLFIQESILFLRLSRRLCRDRSLFPEQRKRRQVADTWRVFITFLPCALGSLESCLDSGFYLRCAPRSFSTHRSATTRTQKRHGEEEIQGKEGSGIQEFKC